MYVFIHHTINVASWGENPAHQGEKRFLGYWFIMGTVYNWGYLKVAGRVKVWHELAVVNIRVRLSMCYIAMYIILSILPQ